MDKKGLIILLCRNTLTYSHECLKTLLKQTVPVEILVVDNASNDGTLQYMASQQAQHSNIFRMNFQAVTSVARCWNEALWWGWARNHTEALVVNSDTELLKDTYRLLHLYLRSSRRNIGMITAVGVDRDPAYPGEQVQVRPHPDYSCYMITARTHRTVPFDQEYDGAYFEDADHHVRMFRAGIWAGSIDLGFLHHASGTLKRADPEERARIERHYARNKERFYRQYGCVPGTRGYEELFKEFEGAPV